MIIAGGGVGGGDAAVPRWTNVSAAQTDLLMGDARMAETQTSF